MSTPENITTPINLAHEVLLAAKDAMCVEDVTREITGERRPTKAQIKPVAKLLKELADLGLIEMEPRAGGTPFYRLIAEPKACTPEAAEEMAEPLDFATSPEVQFLASEDYEMPPADPALLAMANRELSLQLSHIAATCADYLPDPSDITTARAVEIMDMLIDAQRGQIESLSAELPAKDYELVMQARRAIELGVKIDEQDQSIDSLTKDVINTRAALNKAINEADRLRAELAAERQAREALQEQDDAVDVTDAAVGYLIRAPKRKPRLVSKPERARDAALAAVRAGAGRAEVLAMVPVGVARRGAEWQESGPRANGD